MEDSEDDDGACVASTGTGPYPTGKAVEGNTLDALLGPVDMRRKVSAVNSINVNNIISSTTLMVIILIRFQAVHVTYEACGSTSIIHKKQKTIKH